MSAIILGRPDDPPLAAAWAAVQHLGLPGSFVDLNEHGIHLVGSELRRPSGNVALDGVSGFYLRGHGAADPSTAQALRDWAELTPSTVRVVNRRRGSASNFSKPGQSLAIAAAGFRTPTGLLTTDPTAARAFVEQHGKVIVKSASAVRSIVRTVDVHEDFASVAWCPTQFQAFVPGTEYRVHLVGGRVFARRIISDAVDYRYGAAATAPAELPDEVAGRCVGLALALGLELAGLDLRRTPDGEWFCFEANTSPVWTAYDEDGRIAVALARHLAGL
ncbi:ATP-grasp domain-containing protein [Tessaracoccus oleiagri]|uniref:Glutathione synthase/RimK-type ligase, ATP-grasp superfamily n=1 Tax=Tessaracoccus oleiagri TaxID=686624 RepID=A0A1G9JHG5_9ACTN|nr:hypothetical protein [Tessaracoccus oleiagri]SDL36732.1 Glutathione synthase/RimK-type ligase, ATP-grasp superfamily [Tessaracoccus oleiagri]